MTVNAKIAAGSACLLVLTVLVAPSIRSQSTGTAGSELAQKTMTVDELEAYIAKQQEALDAARMEREKQIEKRRQIQESLEDKQKEQARIEAELLKLCAEHKKLAEQDGIDNPESCIPN